MSKISEFGGYIEGKEANIVSAKNMVYPSKNIISYKGVLQVAKGMKKVGQASNISKPIVGEFVWRDHPTGEKKLRASDGKLEIFLDNVWCTIDDQLNPNATEVRFATWFENRRDINVFKTRLLYTDNTGTLREWAGGICKIASHGANSGAVQYIDQFPGRFSSAGKNYQVGDLLTPAGGNNDAKVKVTKVSASGQPDFNYQFGTVVDTFQFSAGSGYVVGELVYITNAAYSRYSQNNTMVAKYGGNSSLVFKVTSINANGGITGLQLVRNTFGFGIIYQWSELQSTRGGGGGKGASVYINSMTDGGIMEWEIIDPGTGYAGIYDDFNLLNGGSGTGATTGFNSSNGSFVTISGTKTPQQCNFERLNVNSYYSLSTKVQIIRKNETSYLGRDQYNYNLTTDNDIVLDKPFVNTPNAGDYIVSGISTIPLPDQYYVADDIISFNDRIYVGSFTSRVVYAMNRIYRDFTYAPTIGSQVNLDTAFNFSLTSQFTSFSKYLSAGNTNVLYISDQDGFTQIKDDTSTIYNASRSVSASRIGSLPYCVTKVNGDIWYLAQDKTIRSIATTVLNKDGVSFISDNIQGLLDRVNVSNAHMYSEGRYMYITLPAEGMLLMYDIIDNIWMSPYTAPIRLMQFADNVKYGFSSVKGETYQMFTGKKKLDAEIEAIIALGTVNGGDEFVTKGTEFVGISGRISPSTNVLLETFIENKGAKADLQSPFDGNKVKTYDTGSNQNLFDPLGMEALGNPDESPFAKRFIAFDRLDVIAYLELQPKMTITGTDVEFALTGLSYDVDAVDRQPSDELIIDNPLQTKVDEEE